MRVVTALLMGSMLAGMGGWTAPAASEPERLDEVWEHFADPPAAFRPAPLYVWNDDMREEEIARQLDEFKAQGIGGVFVHPRPGLVTPYLSERWLELWRFTAEECEKRGMVCDIYDENSYPSGFAGGHVPEAMPESRDVRLRADRFSSDKLDDLRVDSNTLALYRDASGVGAPGRIRLVVEPDGSTGRFWIDGATSAGFFVLGGPLRGGIGFRSIVGRNYRVKHVRVWQVGTDDVRRDVIDDNFDRDALGDAWSVQGNGLTVNLTDGEMALAHDGSAQDSWVHLARELEFEGSTTYFECEITGRSGHLDNNPALVLGVGDGGRVDKALLVDFTDAGPTTLYMHTGGQWRRDGVALQPAPAQLERVELPKRAEGESRTAAQLNLPAGHYVRLSLQPTGTSAWLGGRFYVNLSRKGVTDKFLEITLGAYDKTLKDMYGKTVQACFTDEPHCADWAPDFSERFKERWGYDLLDHLDSLVAETGDWRKVRHDYTATRLQLHIERFARPYGEACAERGIAFTGHVWEHDWPRCGITPDPMSFAACQQYPGIDCLMNQYDEGTHAQFGNHRSNKEVGSIANQLGRERVLCEAYGAAGWETPLVDMKRIGDHLCVGGINLLDPHLSYYTIRGARKRDHPQSFSYHAPWWEAYHLSADYFGRVCWSLAAGQERNPLLLIEPTTTMWMYGGGRDNSPRLEVLGGAFQSYMTELGGAQVEYDLGSEPVMAGLARVEDGMLHVGQRGYSTVILPPGLENLEDSTVKLLTDFAKSGGTIISEVGVPRYVDGKESDAAVLVKQFAGHRWIDGPLPPQELIARAGNGPVLVSVDRDGPRVFHHTRQLADGALVFVINCSDSESANVQCRSAAKGIERWNLLDGTRAVVLGSEENGRMLWSTTLPPAGSALFAVYPDRVIDAPPQPGRHETAWEAGDVAVRTLEPNVLPLDHVDLVLDGETTRGLYILDAQTRIYRKYGFNKNPWDNGVQYKEEILAKEGFPKDSGFELRYSFTTKGWDAPPALRVVVERGDRYTVSVNGRELQPVPDTWWLDKSFTVYDVPAEAVKAGENVISTRAQPFSIHHEPETVYVLGDFALASAQRGWSIEPPRDMQLGSWAKQGRPCYSEGVAYTVHASWKPGARALVRLGDWKGTAVRVDVNGKTAGYLGWPPYELDITEQLEEGDCEVQVVVFGSLHNLLGPHHAGTTRGTAWPSMWWEHPDSQPPGERYDVLDYGLVEPFQLVRVEAR